MVTLQSVSIAVARVEERQEHTLELLRRLELQLPPLAAKVEAIEQARGRERAYAAGAAAVAGIVFSILGKVLL